MWRTSFKQELIYDLTERIYLTKKPTTHVYTDKNPISATKRLREMGEEFSLPIPHAQFLDVTPDNEQMIEVYDPRSNVKILEFERRRTV